MANLEKHKITWNWWKEMNSYHWFVFMMASLAWMFDCLDQQVFILVRRDAMQALAPASDPIFLGTLATSIFMLGWATGGMIFGSVGDRFGRARTLTLTVFLYSIFTGLSALSVGWYDFIAYRFVTGLGVGGVFGLAVALIADSLPPSARTGALGTLQALSAVGNISANLLNLLVAQMVANEVIKPSLKWNVMFLFGAIPALLCVFLQLKLREPPAWVEARRARRADLTTGIDDEFGSYRALFGNARWRRSALFGTLLCIAGVIGIWGIGFFAPDLVGSVIERNIRSDTTLDVTSNEFAKNLATAKLRWVAVNGIIQNVGAFLGMISFTYFAEWIGRRRAFAIAFVCAMLATIGYFRMFNSTSDVWMSGIMGFCQMSLFAGFAIYLPELFPLRLRSTGTSFCYNVGRYVSAVGPLGLGLLKQYLVTSVAGKNVVPTAEQNIVAFRDACTYMSAIFLIGLVAIAFLPETKGKPLPE